MFRKTPFRPETSNYIPPRSVSNCRINLLGVVPSAFDNLNSVTSVGDFKATFKLAQRGSMNSRPVRKLLLERVGRIAVD